MTVPTRRLHSGSLICCLGSCGRVLWPTGAFICTDDHTARFAEDPAFGPFCASCLDAHCVAWDMMEGSAHGRRGASDRIRR